ncbi:type IV pilin [Halorussus sp. MSC15.2]|uniref:type IV pilin n=1 Tax=Halorussus sp. MSC15.2 TaxID=2283638 RepID=UPI0013D217E3|nr:type IV pilin [Halorussus sp. MSC15.2]NEU58477.1 type IV pilin [Halorussus sp. MSC15.2]
MSGRATSPALGIVLLLVVTVALAGTVGSLAFGTTIPSDAPSAVIDLRIDADANRLTFLHRGGDVLDVRDLTVGIRIDDTALDTQPPIPFFSATGFRPGPTGPFNSAADPKWSAGEPASVRLAETNDPSLSSGSSVVVTFSVNASVVAEVAATA